MSRDPYAGKAACVTRRRRVPEYNTEVAGAVDAKSWVEVVQSLCAYIKVLLDHHWVYCRVDLCQPEARSHLIISRGRAAIVQGQP